MRCLNKVFIIGNLGADAILRFTGSGTAVCNISIATTERFKEKDGSNSERTEWHRATLWGKLAEMFTGRLVKGAYVFIEGALRTRERRDDSSISEVEITVQRIIFLDSRKQSDSNQYIETLQDPISLANSSYKDTLGEVPF